MLHHIVFKAMRRVLDRRGYDVVHRASRHPRPIDFIERCGTDLVIDVGANEGQFATDLRRGGYSGAILSLEPVGEAFEVLQRAAHGDGDWQVLRLAAGAEDGREVINVAHSSAYSSFRPANAVGQAFDPEIRTVRTEVVQVRRLDGLAELSGARRPFLKIDTQGFEQAVLAGAPSLLSRAVGLQLELPLVHIYDGVWSFDEALAYLGSLGFIPAQFHPVSVCHDSPESLLEVDCVFRRAPAPVLQ